MKNIFVIVMTFFLATWTSGQNLVPNPSFETDTACPHSYVNVHDSPPWNMATIGTSDYFNACDLTNVVGVPHNNSGYQYARTGNAYMGLLTTIGCWGQPDSREYICAPLASPLSSGIKYYVSMFVNFASRNIYTPNDRIGIYLSNGYPDTTGSAYGFIHKTPQVENPAGNLLTDTVNWVQISGWYIAIGGENYITIGNFRPDSMTMGGTGWNCGYYFIDDVCVSTDSLTCIELTPIKENYLSVNTKLYPNPIDHNATLSFDNTKNEICTLILYDKQGVVVQTTNNITADKVEIKRNNLESGLYFYVLRSVDRVIATGKFVVD